MNMKKSITAYLVCSIVLMGALLLFGHCVPAMNTKTPPSPTPAEMLIHIPGITEPAHQFPCSYGTWDTLKFGLTTEEQLTSWLTSSSLVEQNSLRDEFTEGSVNAFPTHRYIWRVKEEGIYRTSVSLYVISGTLSSLWTSFFYSQTLGTIVNVLGKPEYVSIYLNNRYQDCTYSYDLYYLAQGIRVSGSLYENILCQQMLRDQQAFLEATWPVTDLSCSRGGTAEEVIGAMYGITPEAAAQMAQFLQPWRGFGKEYLLQK